MLSEFAESLRIPRRVTLRIERDLRAQLHALTSPLVLRCKGVENRSREHVLSILRILASHSRVESAEQTRSQERTASEVLGAASQLSCHQPDADVDAVYRTDPIFFSVPSVPNRLSAGFIVDGPLQKHLRSPTTSSVGLSHTPQPKWNMGRLIRNLARAFGGEVRSSGGTRDRRRGAVETRWRSLPLSIPSVVRAPTVELHVSSSSPYHNINTTPSDIDSQICTTPRRLWYVDEDRACIKCKCKYQRNKCSPCVR